MKTRRAIAIELVDRISRGPIPGMEWTPEQHRKIMVAHALWYGSWIEDDLKRLLANDLKPKVGKPRLDFVNCRGTAGRINGIGEFKFFHVDAQADTLAELVEKVEGKTSIKRD
jgi:hypothetical protein